MAATMKIIFSVFILSLMYKDASSQHKNVTIHQSPTGLRVFQKPEWNVTISNDDYCTQLNVILSCPRFHTVKKVDPTILSQQGDKCLINNGNPIYPHTSISFTYAWDNSITFKPLESTVACS